MVSHPKTLLPLEQQSSVVYKITCSCGQLYVGQTGREFGCRKKEHETQWRKRSGAFSDHLSPDHIPNFEDAEIILHEQSNELRELKEAFLIQQVGSKAIQNLNIGQRSHVNRNRGKELEPTWEFVVRRFPPIHSLAADQLNQSQDQETSD